MLDNYSTDVLNTLSVLYTISIHATETINSSQWGSQPIGSEPESYSATKQKYFLRKRITIKGKSSKKGVEISAYSGPTRLRTIVLRAIVVAIMLRIIANPEPTGYETIISLQCRPTWLSVWILCGCISNELSSTDVILGIISVVYVSPSPAYNTLPSRSPARPLHSGLGDPEYWIVKFS
jgi:hypothetical protein